MIEHIRIGEAYELVVSAENGKLALRTLRTLTSWGVFMHCPRLRNPARARRRPRGCLATKEWRDYEEGRPSHRLIAPSASLPRPAGRTLEP
jgi:hypothetical protein